MKTVAELKQIPVISVTHLNRDASDTLENGAIANKANLTRMLGRRNIGESLLMIDNSDFAFILNKDYDKANPDHAYLVLWQMKIRGVTDVNYICQPFEEGNESHILEDLDGVPIFKTTLEDESKMSNMAQVMKQNNIKPGNYNMSNLSLSDEDDDFSSLLSGSSYKPIHTPENGTLGEREKVITYKEEPKEEIKPNIPLPDPNKVCLFKVLVPPPSGPSVLRKQNQAVSLIDFY